MNQKDQRIKKLYERGIKSSGEIARRIGYGGAMEAGVKRVEEGLIRLGIKQEDGRIDEEAMVSE